MTQKDLFLELAKPNVTGKSRWVSTDEFIGKYSSLELLNGLSWGRKSSSLAKKYILEVDKSKTSGNKIDSIRLNGFNTSTASKLSQSIRADIKRDIGSKRCVVLGTNISCDHKTEIDHKDGRKEAVHAPKNKLTKLAAKFIPAAKQPLQYKFLDVML